MSIKRAAGIYPESVLRYFEFRNALGAWTDENQIRLGKMFGLKSEIELKPVSNGLARAWQGRAFPEGRSYRPFDSLWDAYVTISGDANGYYIGKCVRQNAVLPSFEDLLANVLNRLTWEDFVATDYRWQDITTSITSPPDYRENVRTGVSYVPDLPILAEDQPFAELTNLSDVQGQATYSVVERGALLSFSRRVIINDDVELIKRWVLQAGRSAWRTLAKEVWSLISGNTTFGPDRVALFNAAHGNVTTGSAATLSNVASCITMLNTAREAIFQQTEAGGTDRLGLGGGPLLLVVPIQLEPVAIATNRVYTTFDASNVRYDNPWKHRFGKDNENIFANPLLSNTTDWYLFDTSRKVQIVEVGFLGGKQMPQMLVADNPNEGAAFTQDRIVYKMVHEYNAALLDYRGCYAGLVS